MLETIRRTSTYLLVRAPFGSASKYHERSLSGCPHYGLVESFIGRLRDECLNEHVFTSYRHTREIIEEWRVDYNASRAHTSLEGLTPTEFASRSRARNRRRLEIWLTGSSPPKVLLLPFWRSGHLLTHSLGAHQSGVTPVH